MRGRAVHLPLCRGAVSRFVRGGKHATVSIFTGVNLYLILKYKQDGFMHSCSLQQLLSPPSERSSRIWDSSHQVTFLQSAMKVLVSRRKLFYRFPAFCWQVWLLVRCGLLDSRFGILCNQRCLPWLFEWLFDLSLPWSMMMNFSKSFWPSLNTVSWLVDYNNFRRLEMKDSTPHSWVNASDFH